VTRARLLAVLAAGVCIDEAPPAAAGGGNTAGNRCAGGRQRICLPER
jgi:hypothetical protein